MKLIPMTDFVINESENKEVSKNFSGFSDIVNNKKLSYDNILNYAKFLKQPLELWMFVPCGEDGNVLDAEPCSLGMFAKDNPFFDVYLESKNIWDKAKEKCLFEGFVITEESFIHDLPHFYIEIDGIKMMWNFNNKWVFYKGFKTIEDLVKYDLQLTQKAIKKIHQ